MWRLLLMLTAVMMLSCNIGIAESLGIQEKTLDELIEIRSLIDEEINERLTEKRGVFYPFDYSVGKHVPAGHYLYTCLEVTNGKSSGLVAVWAQGKNNGSCHILEWPEQGEVFFIELNEGDTLRISDCLVTLQPYILPSI